MPNTNTEWLTVEEVAKELKVHIERVRRWIRDGELIATDLGRDYRINREDLQTFLKARRTGKKQPK
jgi:excisionase family DNA binding protein